MEFILPNKDNVVGIIYLTTNLLNGKKYIGQHNRVDDSYLGSGNILGKAIKLYGKENFKREILQYCINSKDLNESEIYWINYFGADKSDLFYNVTKGGESDFSSFERREKQRLSKLGTKQSSEHIENRISKLRDRKRPTNVGEAIRQSRLGVKTSEETKLLLSKSRENKCVGKNNPQSRAIVQLDTDGNYIKTFECITDASHISTNIWRVLNGSLETTNGFKWMYLTEFDKIK